MTDERSRKPEEENIRARVTQGIDEARQFARELDFEQVKSGEWFVRLLQKVVQSYDRNARAEYFRQKYPGLPPDEIADVLISVATRYAAVAGGVAGAAATSAQVSTLASAGMTAPVFFGVIGSEMIYLSRIQLRLVLDLSVLYDLQLDAEDPEDVLMVFGYAMGIAPAEIAGKFATRAAGGATRTLVKRYISKNVLKALQDFARRLGFRILQRTILKYTVPAVSAAVGGGYNYLSTRALGNIAKNQFKNLHKFSADLQHLVSRKNTYPLVFPAAALHLAKLDGEFSLKEYEMYKALISRMSFPEHTPEQLQHLAGDEEEILRAATGIEDPEERRTLVDVLVLMAASDGDLGDEEQRLLTILARRLEVPLDLDYARRKAAGYWEVGRAGPGEGDSRKSAAVKSAAAKGATAGVAAVKSGAGWAAGQLAERAVAARTGMRDRLSRAARRPPAEQGPPDPASEKDHHGDHRGDHRGDRETDPDHEEG